VKDAQLAIRVTKNIESGSDRSGMGLASLPGFVAEADDDFVRCLLCRQPGALDSARACQCRQFAGVNPDLGVDVGVVLPHALRRQAADA